MAVNPNLLPVGLIVQIPSVYMPGITTAPHRSPVIVYCESRCSHVIPFLCRNWVNIEKMEFSHRHVFKSATAGGNCSYSTQTYFGHNRCMTQKPQDHLF